MWNEERWQVKFTITVVSSRCPGECILEVVNLLSLCRRNRLRIRICREVTIIENWIILNHVIVRVMFLSVSLSEVGATTLCKAGTARQNCIRETWVVLWTILNLSLLQENESRLIIDFVCCSRCLLTNLGSCCIAGTLHRLTGGDFTARCSKVFSHVLCPAPGHEGCLPWLSPFATIEEVQNALTKQRFSVGDVFQLHTRRGKINIWTRYFTSVLLFVPIESYLNPSNAYSSDICWLTAAGLPSCENPTPINSTLIKSQTPFLDVQQTAAHLLRQILENHKKLLFCSKISPTFSCPLDKSNGTTRNSHLSPRNSFTIPNFVVYRTNRLNKPGTLPSGGTDIVVHRRVSHRQVTNLKFFSETTAVPASSVDLESFYHQFIICLVHGLLPLNFISFFLLATLIKNTTDHIPVIIILESSGHYRLPPGRRPKTNWTRFHNYLTDRPPPFSDIESSDDFDQAYLLCRHRYIILQADVDHSTSTGVLVPDHLQ
ncbi:hypothetical protein J6590_029016 [Homalodisca vitripennis]|nr:hypothetical protein J6590_029016 [Homalodisca vitripennis]